MSDYITIKDVLNRVFGECLVEFNDNETINIETFLHIELIKYPKKTKTISGERDIIVDMYRLSMYHDGSDIDLGDYYNLTTLLWAVSYQIVKDKVNCEMSNVSGMQL